VDGNCWIDFAGALDTHRAYRERKSAHMTAILQALQGDITKLNVAAIASGEIAHAELHWV
jgi:hypothetical protein